MNRATDQTSNLWHATSGAQLVAPPLTASATVDLAVIGGGFTGCSAALEAARRGASVCLLEARTIGYGGSGRNVGLLNAGLWLPPDTIVAQMGQAAGRRLIAALAEAPSLVFALIESEEIDCEATRKGTLHLAHSSAGLRDLQERYRQGIRFGAPLELLDGGETALRTGISCFYGALWDPRAGTIQPLSYCRGLARAALRAGAQVHEESPVLAIDRRDGEWVIGVNGHEVRAKALLMATNAYHFGITSPFQPEFVAVSYCQFATKPLPKAVRQRILAGGEGCWDTARVMSSFRVDQAGRLIVGGIGNLKGAGARIHGGWARRKLHALFPDLAHFPFEYAWCGRIAMTSDHIPKIVEFGPSALACFGYSGRGIGPGTVFGRQAAIALLEGTVKVLPVEPIHSYSERFVGLREAYYDFGAALTHAFQTLPLFRG